MNNNYNNGNMYQGYNNNYEVVYDDNQYNGMNNEEPPKKKKKWLLLLLLLLLLLIASFLAYFVLFGNNKSKQDDGYEDYNPNYEENSNVTSNLESNSNVTSNIESNSNVTSNIVVDNTVPSNSNSNITSNTTVKVSSVKISASATSVKVGSTVQLKAVITPSNATNKNVTWKSSNTSVATIDSNGKVIGKKAGTAKITVTTKDGGYTSTINITVKANTSTSSGTTVAVTGVDISTASQTIYPGNTLALKVSVSPSNATNKSITWKSSDESVATVSNSGVVTAKARGDVTITATSNNGKADNVKIKVRENPKDYEVVLTKATYQNTSNSYSIAVYKNGASITDYIYVTYGSSRVIYRSQVTSGSLIDTSITSGDLMLTGNTDVDIVSGVKITYK